MKYEYKIIGLADLDDAMSLSDTEILQEWFDKGWEYVDSITQPFATGSSGSWKSAVAIIIRKEKEIDPLN